MTARTKYHEQLCTYIKQRRPIIHIDTWDYDFEEKELTGMLYGQGLTHISCGGKGKVPGKVSSDNIFVWDAALGKCNIYSKAPVLTKEGETMSLFDAISDMVAIKDNAILVIKGLWGFYDKAVSGISAEALQIMYMLLRFYKVNNAKVSTDERNIIFIIGPSVDLPIELRNFVTTIKASLPDDNDILIELGLRMSSKCLAPGTLYKPLNGSGHLYELDLTKERLDEILIQGGLAIPQKGYRFDSTFFYNGKAIFVYERNIKLLLQAFKGLTISQIREILQYSDHPNCISQVRTNSFRAQKEELVKRSGLLRVEYVADGYEKFVGDIDGLKKYMERESLILNHPECYNPYMPLPKGILLVGPPGCGKSESTKAIASILGLPLLSLDMGSLISSYVGESEHNFQAAIAIAEAAQPCVLRIDEIEKAFSGSEGGNDAGSQSMTHILGFFLTWMQERKSMVYIVATANSLDQLRPEFLRKGRWDEIFYISYPSLEGVMKIIDSCLNKYHLSLDDKKSLKKEIDKVFNDFSKLHKHCPQISGAEIFDIIEQTYKTLFKGIKSYDSCAAQEIVIPYVEVVNRLRLLVEKPRNPLIEEKIKEELLAMKINLTLQQKTMSGVRPWHTDLEKDMRNLLREKYKEYVDYDSLYASKGYKSVATWADEKNCN